MKHRADAKRSDPNGIDLIGDRLVFASVRLWFRLFRRQWIREFYKRQGYIPDVAVPSRCNDKIQWRKLFDSNPVFGQLSDKLIARPWMISRCPDLAMARVIWAGQRPEDIPDAALRGGVVVKTNHASGQNIVLSAPPTDRKTIEKTLRRWLKKTYGRQSGEWAYGQIDRRVFVEELLPNSPADPLADYAFYCCDGRVAFFVLTYNEHKPEKKRADYRTNGIRHAAPMLNGVPDAKPLPDDFVLPAHYAEAARMAGAISEGFDFVRVDIMVAGGKFYAGEMTFYPGAGCLRYPDIAAAELTEAWDIRKSWFMRMPQHGLRGLYARALLRQLGKQQSGQV